MSSIEAIHQAEVWATELHSTQKRKGKDIPYITHPARVAAILEEIGAEPEIIIAGWLHDTVEDQGVLLSEIRQRFGPRVERMVGDVTEMDKSLPWEVRKRQAEEHIPHMRYDSLLLKSADVLANTEAMIADYQSVGESLFDIFNGSKIAQLVHKANLVNAIAAAWPDNPLLSKLQTTHEKFISVLGGGVGHHEK